jgi:hypothetical protein
VRAVPFTRQPSSNILPLSSRAVAGVGLMAETFSCSGAAALRAPVTAPAGAASRPGRTMTTAKASATAAVVKPPPSASERRGRAASVRERRKRSSMRWWLITVGTPEASVTRTRSPTVSGPHTAAAITIAGQCHRYHA